MKRYGQYGRKPSWIVHMRTPLPHPRLPVPGEALRVTFDDVTSSEKAPLRRILRNFRLLMRAHKGTPFGVTWHSVTSGSHGTCTTVLLYYYSIKKKTRWKSNKKAGNPYFRWRHFRSCDFLWRHFRLCDFRSSMRNGQILWILRKYDFVRTHILLIPIHG